MSGARLFFPPSSSDAVCNHWLVFSCFFFSQFSFLITLINLGDVAHVLAFLDPKSPGSLINILIK
jgi:hypothetical protein